MNFINAMKKGKRIRRTSQIDMWIEAGAPNYWYTVSLIKSKGLDYHGIDLNDVMATDWEIKD